MQQVAVEAKFVEYKLTGDKQSLTPDLLNWKNDVLTLYATWKGNNAEMTLRKLVQDNYPDARTLSDLAQIQTPDETLALGKLDQCCQTTGRIYTFPLPQTAT